MKTFSGNYFTPLCVFGIKGKYDQPEILLHFDHKKPLLTRKTIFILILPSNVLHFSHNPHTHSQTSHTWRSQPTPPSSPIHKHLRSTSPIANHASTSIGWAPILTTDRRPSSTKLSNTLVDLAAPTTSPLHSTPKPTWFSRHCLHPLWSSLSRSISLSLDLSLFLSPFTKFVNKKCFYFDFWLC